MAATWADIKRLVTDLQRVQLSESAKRLSEANCIELVSKLIRRSLIDVIFTRDGYSYITRKHLATEVKNECLASGGRIPLTDIATTLGVDLEHVERSARELVAENIGYMISGGELFAEEYVTNLQLELRSLLAECGYKSLSTLCKHWNLSQELLRSLLLDRLPEDFNGVVDGDSIFTMEYLESHKNILRALLSAITKPLSVTVMQARVGLPINRFWWAFDKLLETGEVSGRLSGARSSSSCTYIPKIHDDLVQVYVQSFFRQQEFISTAVLRKLGFSESIGSKNGHIEDFLRKDNTDLKIQVLPSVLLSSVLFQQCLTTIKEAVEASGVCDVKSVLQPFAIPFDDSDFLKISEMVSSSESNLYCAGSHVFSDHLLSEVVERLGDHIDTWVNKLITKFEQDRKGSHHQHKKIEADSEWSDSKRGGKKKGGRGSGGKINKSHEVMHEESPAPTIGVPSETLEEWVTKIGAVPEEILVDVVERIESRVDEKIRARLSEIAATHRNTAAQSQKRNLAQLQQQAQSLYTSICMFEDSSSSFPDALRTELNQYVLRNVGTELANAILSCASETENVHLMKEKQRDATIAALSVELRSGVSSLYNSLRESTLDNFHSAVFDLSSPKTLSLVLKHPDSKARTEMLEKYVAELREQVQVQSEPAAALLSCVLFLLARNGKPVAASGRFVAQLVRQLSDIVDQSLFENLVSCQRLVVHCLKNKDDEVSRDMLMSDIEKLKQAVIS